MSTTNGNGAGSLTQRKLEELLAYHQQKAASLRDVLDLLVGHAIEKRQVRAPNVLEQALAMEEGRVVRAKPSPKARVKVWSKEANLARRQRTATILADMSRTTPTPKNGLGKAAGGFLRAGLVRKVPGGYVRTAQPFVVDTRASAQAAAAPARKQTQPIRPGKALRNKRKQTAALLAKFSEREVRPAPAGVPNGAIGSLVRRGYLLKNGDGYRHAGREYITG